MWTLLLKNSINKQFLFTYQTQRKGKRVICSLVIMASFKMLLRSRFMGTLEGAPRLLLVIDVVISVTKHEFHNFAMDRSRAMRWPWRVERPRVGSK